MSGRVVAALSGGVDSAVAAALLKDEGYEVVGIHLRLWSSGLKPDHPCCGEDAVRDARAVCVALQIPFHILDLETEFRRYVIDYFTGELERGRTPNPCIVCNQCLKFGFLLQHALAIDAGHIATGHYARIEHREGAYHLLKSPHAEKDQSYALHILDQARLNHILFPLGGLSKTEVRRIAREKSLPVAGKPDSQDLCFLHDDPKVLLPPAAADAGDIVDGDGRVLGRHHGVGRFTIGQRSGLGITTRERVYVTQIDAAAHRIVVGPEADLLHTRLVASGVNWIPGPPPAGPVEITAKIRYKAEEAAATLRFISAPPGTPAAGAAPWADVTFAEAQRAITPGQAVVFYQGSEVLGGGTIERAGD